MEHIIPLRKALNYSSVPRKYLRGIIRKFFAPLSFKKAGRRRHLFYSLLILISFQSEREMRTVRGFWPSGSLTMPQACIRSMILAALP